MERNNKVFISDLAPAWDAEPKPTSHFAVGTRDLEPADQVVVEPSYGTVANTFWGSSPEKILLQTPQFQRMIIKHH